MTTDKDIQDAIENCKWRKDLHGVWICEGDIVPCLKHINDGRCDTLIKLFAKEGADDAKEGIQIAERQDSRV